MNRWTGDRTFPRISLGSAASLWALLTGCGGDPTSSTNPTEGVSVATEPTQSQPDLRHSQAPSESFTRLAAPLDFDGEIDVWRTRLLSGFEAETAAELGRAVARLASISISGDRPGTERALAAMRAALRDGAAGPADLDAASRTIDAMQLALDASPR